MAATSELHDAILQGSTAAIREAAATSMQKEGPLPALREALELLQTAEEVDPSSICDAVEALLELSADPNVSMSSQLNDTPLQAALGSGTSPAHIQVARALLQGRADPNRLNGFGEGPLFEAASLGSIEACELLLAFGAKASAQNAQRKSPVEFASDDRVKELLTNAATGESIHHPAGPSLDDSEDDEDDEDLDRVSAFGAGLARPPSPTRSDTAAPDSSSSALRSPSGRLPPVSLETSEDANYGEAASDPTPKAAGKMPPPEESPRGRIPAQPSGGRGQQAKGKTEEARTPKLDRADSKAAESGSLLFDNLDDVTVGDGAGGSYKSAGPPPPKPERPPPDGATRTEHKSQNGASGVPTMNGTTNAGALPMNSTTSYPSQPRTESKTQNSAAGAMPVIPPPVPPVPSVLPERPTATASPPSSGSMATRQCKFLISDEEKVVNIYVQLETLFEGASEVFTSEDCFDLQAFATHLEVRFRGPSSRTAQDEVCWLLQSNMPTVISAKEVTLKLRKGKLTIKLPKALNHVPQRSGSDNEDADEEAEQRRKDEAELVQKQRNAMRGSAASTPASDASKPARTSAKSTIAAAMKVSVDTPRHSSDGSISPATNLREAGNEQFKAANFEEAINCYTQALKLEPDNSAVLSNRAAACLMLGDWDQALEDSREAVRLDDDNAKAIERQARTYLLLDRLKDSAELCRQKVQRLGEARSKQKEWEGFMATTYRISHHMGTIREIENVLRDRSKAESEQSASTLISLLGEMRQLLSEHEARSPWGRRLRLNHVKAQLYALPGRSGQPEERRRKWAEEACEEAAKLVAEDANSAEYLHWWARSLLRRGQRQDAREGFKMAMRANDGEHQASEDLLDSIKLVERNKEQGNEAFQRQEWEPALQHYDVAIQADRLRLDADFSAALFCNRSAVRSKKGQTTSALADVTEALAISPGYTKALFRRGILYMELERYRNASTDFEQVAKTSPNFVGLASWRARARRWAARPPPRNHYAVLGLGFEATAAEIKKAYRAAALKWHPDKNPERGEKAEKMFKDIQEAFETLSDPAKRRDFDGLDEPESHFFPGHGCGGGFPRRSGRGNFANFGGPGSHSGNGFGPGPSWDEDF